MTAYRHTTGTLLPLTRRWPDEVAVPSARVECLAALMQRGVVFPPVRVFFGRDGKFMVQDGNTRTAASLRLGFSHIPAVTNPNPWGQPWSFRP